MNSLADNEEYIKRLFPLVEQIKDTLLKDKVIEAWLRAWRDSTWERIELAVFRPVLKASECTLVEHVNVVAAGVLYVGQLIHENFRLPVDFDALLAGALLHDVAKLVEYGPKDDHGERTDIGKMIHHAFYGAHIALDLGIPIKIVELIVAHTPQNRALPCSIEGIILDYLDYMAYDVVSFNAGHKILLSAMKRQP